jgi:hypothetical protein
MTTVSSTEAITVTAPAPSKSHFWAGSELRFTDLLAAINPLQHLPIIGTIYRAITGDTIGNVARVVGDGLYGGPIGLASGLVDVAAVEATGKDIGQHVIATLQDIGDALDPSAPSAPEAPAPATPDALMAVAGQVKDPPKLPLLGSATTAGELAAAAPVSPLLAPKLAAQVSSPAPGAIRPLPGASRPIPIDVSDHGIAMMRANSAAHSPRPVALNLPAGALGAASAPAAAKPAVDGQPDFAERMRDGLAKYDGLVAARSRDATSGSVDQLH